MADPKRPHPSRRRFIASAARAGAVAVASMSLPRAMPARVQPATAPATSTAQKKLGWAVVGLGSLARGHLLPALTKADYSRLAALVSGDAAKEKAIAERFKLNAAHLYDYESFDRIKDDADVDVVYVVLPNGMHAEYAIRAAEAGKHVFCEKPMACTVADCQRMIDACAAAKRRLSIAYRMHYDPNLIEARRVVRAGEIGKVTSITSAFGFNIHGLNWRLNKKLAGGGPLMDIGIYSLNAARFVTGEEPVEVSAKVEQPPDDPRFKEVEAAMDFTLKFPGGAVATCRTAYNALIGTSLRIVGERGWINCTPAFMYNGNLMSLSRNDVEKVEWRIQPLVNQFVAEIDDFSRCILENKPSRTPGEEGLKDLRVIEALYRAAAEQKPVSP